MGGNAFERNRILYDGPAEESPDCGGSGFIFEQSDIYGEGESAPLAASGSGRRIRCPGCSNSRCPTQEALRRNENH